MQEDELPLDRNSTWREERFLGLFYRSSDEGEAQPLDTGGKLNSFKCKQQSASISSTIPLVMRKLQPNATMLATNHESPLNNLSSQMEWARTAITCKLPGCMANLECDKCIR